MPVSAALRRELLALPAEEREEIAEELYESLVEQTSDPEWQAEWSKEIAARLEDAASSPGESIDANEMIRQLRVEFAAKP